MDDREAHEFYAALRSAWDVSMTLDPAAPWNDVCHYDDATRKLDGIAAGVIRVIPRTAGWPFGFRAAGTPVITSWTIVTRAPSHGEGIDLLKAAEPLLRERLAGLADGRARYFQLLNGALAEAPAAVAPGIARVNRVGGWLLEGAAVASWPAWLWIAVIWSWAAVLVPLVITAFAVLQRLALRKVYGMRGPSKAERLAAMREHRSEYICECKAENRAFDGFRVITQPDGRLAVWSDLAQSEVPPPDWRPVQAASASTSDMTLGFARLGAARGPCAHPDAEPVDLLVTGERVAWLCPECGAELPAGWR